MYSPEQIEEMRRELRARGDVPEDQIDEIIEIALDLESRDRARLRADGELPPDEGSVEAPAPGAIVLERAADIQATRNARIQEERRAERQLQERRHGVVRGLLWTAFALLIVTVLGSATALVLTAGPIHVAGEKARLSQARLEQLIVEQATLAPRVAELSGDEALEALTQEVRHAVPGPPRLAASDALWVAMSQALGDMPVPRTYTALESQRAIERELAESHDRLAPERQTYRALLEEWRAVSQGRLAGWAIRLGLTEGPPPPT